MQTEQRLFRFLGLIYCSKDQKHLRVGNTIGIGMLQWTQALRKRLWFQQLVFPWRKLENWWQKDWNFKKKAFCPDKCKYFLLIEKANDINVNNKQDEKNADDAEKNLINYIIIILYINNTTWYIFHISIRYSLKEGDRVDLWFITSLEWKCSRQKLRLFNSISFYNTDFPQICWQIMWTIFIFSD